MASVSNHFDTDANLTGAFFFIADDPLWSQTSNHHRQNSIDSISGESCQPPLSESSTEGDFPPLHPFSFHSPHFIFVSIRHWNVIQPAQQAIRTVWETTFKAKSETQSYPLPFCNPPPPWFPNGAGQGKGVFFFNFHIMSAGESISMPDFFFFFLTWTRSEEGSLGLSTSLACNPWTSWFQHRGESGVGGGEDSAQTDVQYTQLMPQAGKSNNIICARQCRWISYLLPNMSIGRGGNIATAANTTMLMSRISEWI